eukprot:354069-Chlamydomonas_euryale.AAC.14
MFEDDRGASLRPVSRRWQLRRGVHARARSCRVCQELVGEHGVAAVCAAACADGRGAQREPLPRATAPRHNVRGTYRLKERVVAATAAATVATACGEPEGAARHRGEWAAGGDQLARPERARRRACGRKVWSVRTTAHHLLGGAGPYAPTANTVPLLRLRLRLRASACSPRRNGASAEGRVVRGAIADREGPCAAVPSIRISSSAGTLLFQA